MVCRDNPAIAHQNVVTRLEEEVLNRLVEFGAQKRDDYDVIVVDGKIQQDLLKVSSVAMDKTQSRYYKACTEHEQAELTKSKKIDEKRLAKDECRVAYEAALTELNKVERYVHAALRVMLESLHGIGDLYF